MVLMGRSPTYGGARKEPPLEEACWRVASTVVTADPEDDDEAAKLVATEIDKLLASRKEKDASKVHRFLKKSRPLVRFMKTYGKAVDVAANMSPEVLTPLWATLRAVLTVGT